jgi:hypothetical protein
MVLSPVQVVLNTVVVAVAVAVAAAAAAAAAALWSEKLCSDIKAF